MQHSQVIESIGSERCGVKFADLAPEPAAESAGHVFGRMTLKLQKSLLAAFFLAAGVAQAAPVYVVTDLGTLGGVDNLARAIGSAGQVVGFSWTPDGQYQAVLWQNGSVNGLGTLGGGYSSASDISNSGQVVGVAYVAGDEQARAVLWQNGSVTDLGSLGGTNSSALGINNVGQVVGYSETLGDTQTHAFLWQNGSMIDLGTPDGASSYAEAINDAGQVVGTVRTTDTIQAVLWQNGSMTNLGTLGGNYSVANDVNNSGQVIGSASTAGNSQHAFLWQNGSMTDLGTLGGSHSVARAINTMGQVVGSSTTGLGSAAFIYDAGQMFNINELLSPLSAGWSISIAHDINDAGQIAAYGCHVTLGCRAVRLDVLQDQVDVPLPAPLMLFGAGLMAWVVRRRAH